METYNNLDDYNRVLEDRSALPEGFVAGCVPLTFFPEEKELVTPLPMNLSAILLKEPTESFAAVFTRNSFPGFPVLDGKEKLKNNTISGVIINNKISNVRCPGGMESVQELTSRAAETFSLEKNSLFSSSTGIIGWKLPVANMVEALPSLKESLQEKTLLEVSRGIMTTDAFAKIRSVEVGEGRITGICKGAGMIEPNMATMLVYILTDLSIERDKLREIFSRVINRSFNRISVDSDQSTSDTAMIFSSCIAPSVEESLFEKELEMLCRDLAQDIVRNGEGTGHVLDVTVKGLASEDEALIIAKGVINAPLVKTAVFGNDPNVGRLIQAAGDAAGNNGIEIDPLKTEISLGGDIVFQKGYFELSQEKEESLSNYLKSCALTPELKGYPEHNKNVEIVIDFNSGSESVQVFGSDLSYEYVKENADYRS